jgi:hypothetical protein
MRPKVQIVCLVGMIMCTIAAIRSTSAAPQAYPMMCRGGGDMTISVTRIARGTALAVYFTRGGRASNPGPGECTWMDRGMRSDEPMVMSFDAIDSSVVPYIRASGKIRRFTYEGRERAHLQYLVDSVLQGKPFQVHAYQKEARGNNYFSVVRVGP